VSALGDRGHHILEAAVQKPPDLLPRLAGEIIADEPLARGLVGRDGDDLDLDAEVVQGVLEKVYPGADADDVEVGERGGENLFGRAGEIIGARVDGIGQVRHDPSAAGPERQYLPAQLLDGGPPRLQILDAQHDPTRAAVGGDTI
jgi:hypothetical protein